MPIYRKIYSLKDINFDTIVNNDDFIRDFKNFILDKTIDIPIQNTIYFYQEINQLFHTGDIAEYKGNGIKINEQADLDLTKQMMESIKDCFKDEDVHLFNKYGRGKIHDILYPPSDSYLYYKDKYGDYVITSLFDFVYRHEYKYQPEVLIIPKLFYVKI